MLDTRAGARVEADVVASYEAGPVLALIDLGMIDEIVQNTEDTIEIRPGGGLSFRLSSDFRVGAEVYGELTLTGTDVSWLVAGPTLSVTPGRFWAAATIRVGLLGVRDAGRITFGAAL